MGFNSIITVLFISVGVSIIQIKGLKPKITNDKPYLETSISSFLDIQGLQDVFGLPKKKTPINKVQIKPGTTINRKPSISIPAIRPNSNSGIIFPSDTQKVPPPLPLQLCGKRSLLYVKGPIFSRKRRATEVSAPKIDDYFPIAGGVSSKRNSWPWMVLLGNKVNGKIEWFCGGVLINSEWILTAAHCLEKKTANVIRLGEHDYSEDNDGGKIQDFTSQKIVFHPNYKYSIAYHDLALVKLNRRANLSPSVSPVCLPWWVLTNQNLEGRKLTITGWGSLQYGGPHHPVLQETSVTVNSTKSCDNSYKRLPQYSIAWPQGIASDTTFCAGGHGRDSCPGDSGGPAVFTVRGYYVLAGLVSKGYGCANPNFPGVYVNINQEKYLRWIKSVAF